MEDQKNPVPEDQAGPDEPTLLERLKRLEAPDSPMAKAIRRRCAPMFMGQMAESIPLLVYAMSQMSPLLFDGEKLSCETIWSVFVELAKGNVPSSMPEEFDSEELSGVIYAVMNMFGPTARDAVLGVAAKHMV